MGPFDPFEDTESSENAFIELPMSRRTFLGGVGASTLASAALAGDPTPCDETALKFAWGNDPKAGGARVLDVSIITRAKPAEDPKEDNEPENETPGEENQGEIFSDFGAFTEGTADAAADWFWRIRPEAFGPQAYFALKTSRTNQLLRYELRVADVSFGRLRPVKDRRRSITFIFQQIIVSEDCNGEKRDTKRFELSATTDIWSSENGPNTTNSFTMSGMIVNKKRQRVLFRDFIKSNDTKHALYIDVPLRRVTNTTALMFNALITRQPGKGNPTVDLWFLNNGRWRVRSTTGAIAAFNGRVALSGLDIFWPNVNGPKQRAAAEAPLLAIGTPVANDPRLFTIGRGQNAPAFSGEWVDGATKVYFRAQRPSEIDDSETTFRAEAMLQTEWKAVSFLSTESGQSVTNLPRLYGAVLERVDHPDKLDNANPARNAGSISFQARYGTRDKTRSEREREGFTALQTSIGKFTTV
ncbi:MAG: hypothetical protein AB3N11_11170, partial [Arenibacterium sp.]